MVNELDKFKKEVIENIKNLGNDRDLQSLSNIWMREVGRYNWSYNFRWLGRPAIQLPNDTWAMQELIWLIKPDLIIETGIAHGGSLIYNASMLALLDICDAIDKKEKIDPSESNRLVLGIDIDIREHNRKEIESHPMFSRIQMIEGSSTDQNVVDRVKSIASNYKTIMLCLDSNHTHDHVLKELECYAPLVTSGSYCVVLDTIIDDLPEDLFSDRPWAPGNNPKTAVREYLSKHPEFQIDTDIQHKLLITVAPDGYLKKVK